MSISLSDYRYVPKEWNEVHKENLQILRQVYPLLSQKSVNEIHEYFNTIYQLERKTFEPTRLSNLDSELADMVKAAYGRARKTFSS